MEIELHRLRQHLNALTTALGKPTEGDVAQLLGYLDADVSEAELTWSQFRSALTQLDRLPKLSQTDLSIHNTQHRRRVDRDPDRKKIT
jgi:hypothetical protein